MMDLPLIDYAVGVITAGFAWVAKRLHSRVDDLENKLSDLDKEQAVQASQLKDLKEDIHQINKKLDRILDIIHK